MRGRVGPRRHNMCIMELIANLGPSIPVTLTFEQATGKNVLLLPMGSSTDAAHSINEKLDKKNYIEGIKLLGAYLHYVAEEPITN